MSRTVCTPLFMSQLEARQPALMCRTVSGVQRKCQFQPPAMRCRQRRQRRAPQHAPQDESVLSGHALQRAGAEAVAVRPSQEAVRGEDGELAAAEVDAGVGDAQHEHAAIAQNIANGREQRARIGDLREAVPDEDAVDGKSGALRLIGTKGGSSLTTAPANWSCLLWYAKTYPLRYIIGYGHESPDSQTRRHWLDLKPKKTSCRKRLPIGDLDNGRPHWYRNDRYGVVPLVHSKIVDRLIDQPLVSLREDAHANATQHLRINSINAQGQACPLAGVWHIKQVERRG